ncbi:MAG: SURF1 family cytochrome oxidase biogenesis protein [Actinomycetes bacterium]
MSRPPRVLRTRRWVGLTALAVFIAAACVLLGRWQLSRFDYRSEYNRLVDRNSSSAPVDVTRLLAGRPSDADLTSRVEFRQVVARGTYVAGAQLVVRQRTYADSGSQGFEVLTPLRTDTAVVLVDRGWVPAGSDPLATPQVPAPPAGSVEVRGLLRDSEHSGQGGADPFAHLPDGQVSRIDTAAIARHTGLPLLPGYVQLASQVPPVSSGIQLLPSSVNHQNAALNLAYTVQWWVFAVVALGALVVFARREVKDAGGETGGNEMAPRNERATREAGPRRPQRQPAGGQGGSRGERRQRRSGRGLDPRLSRDEWLAGGDELDEVPQGENR